MPQGELYRGPVARWNRSSPSSTRISTAMERSVRRRLPHRRRVRPTMISFVFADNNSSGPATVDFSAPAAQAAMNELASVFNSPGAEVGFLFAVMAGNHDAVELFQRAGGVASSRCASDPSDEQLYHSLSLTRARQGPRQPLRQGGGITSQLSTIPRRAASRFPRGTEILRVWPILFMPPGAPMRGLR